jgi:hypothetical protein
MINRIAQKTWREYDKYEPLSHWNVPKGSISSIRFKLNRSVFWEIWELATDGFPTFRWLAFR